MDNFREELVILMDLKFDKSLSEDQKKEIILKKCNENLNYIKQNANKFYSIEYKLSKRQEKVKEIANVALKEYRKNTNTYYISCTDIYFEIWDFLDDYGDRHDGKISQVEADCLKTLLEDLKECCEKEKPY